MAPIIVQMKALLEVQGVQNSSFELQCSIFTLLVEEKAIGLKISVFRPSSLFPLPIEETAHETSKTRVFSHAIAFSPCLSRKRPARKKGCLSLGASRAKANGP